MLNSLLHISVNEQETGTNITKNIIRKAVKCWGEKKNRRMVKKVPPDAGQKTTAEKFEQLVLVDEAVQARLQEVPATSKAEITNELTIPQEEFQEQLKVATNMFSLDGGSELESDNSDSDSETDDE